MAKKQAIINDENFVEVEEQESAAPENKETHLQCTDPGWTDYVLNEVLTDTEKVVDNNKRILPRVRGLRRVLLKFFHIVSQNSTFTDIFVSKNENGINIYNTRCVHHLVVEDFVGRRVQFVGSADVSIFNTDPKFVVHSTAVAETKACGRAFINALNLQTVSFEEIQDNNAISMEKFVPSSDTSSANLVSDAQVRGINSICGKYNINVSKFLEIQNKIKINGKITNDQAQTLLGLLNDYQRGTTPIPDSIRGYKTWKPD